MARKKHKIMTVTDLYNFCVKNNFCHFSSLDDNEEICVQLPATFESEENFDKDKEGLTPFIAKAYHDHINLNKSEIKPEVLESTLPSAMLRPILASIVVDEKTGEKDFGAHDFTIEQDEDGNEIFKYIEQPVGVIFGENYIEHDDEDDVNRAILHGFLFNGYCQDAVDIMNRRGSVACSVELSIREMSYNAVDRVLTLDDFYVSGLTLLGASVKPGMKNSKLTIKDFCKKGNKTFSQDNEKLIEMLEQLNTKIDNLSNFTIQANAEENFEEGRNETVDETKIVEEVTELMEETPEEVAEEVVEETTEEEVTETIVEDTVEETPDVVVEESEEETVEVSEEFAEDDKDEDDNKDDDKEDVDDKEDDEDEEKEVFSKTFELSHDDIRAGLYNLLRPYEEANNDWYWIVEVFDNHFVYQGCMGNYFGQKYVKENDSVAFDGEPYALYSEFLTESERVALTEMRSNYAVISTELNSYKEAESIADKMTVFEDEAYASYLETDVFKSLMEKETVKQFSKEELVEKADAALGKLVKTSKTFSMKEEKVETKKPAFFAFAQQTKDTSFLDGLLKK